MKDRRERRRLCRAGVIASGVGFGMAVLTLLLLRVQACVGLEGWLFGEDPATGMPLNLRTRAPMDRRTGHQRSNAHPQGWQTVLSDTFESGLGSDWIVTDTSAADGGTYVWGTSTFTYVSGERSAWCAGRRGEGWDQGWNQLGDFYTDSMDAWLVSAPIALGELGSHVWEADVQFAWWLDARFDADRRGPVLGTRSVQRVNAPPPSGDWLGWGVVTDVTSLENEREPKGRWTYVSGATVGWVRGSLPLDAFLPRGDGLTGRGTHTDTIRVAFRFVSDDDGAVGRGAFIDDVVLRVNYGYGVALPLVVKELGPTPRPTIEDLVVNGGFEADWGEEQSHRVKVFPVDGDPYVTELGEFHTPPGWLSWFRHDPGTWDQPEVGDIRAEHVPYRVHSGEKAARLFTFYRKHDAGFMQQVAVEPGTPLTLTAYAHAWSNHPIEGHEDCKDNGHCSAGVGWGGHFLLPEDVPPLNGDPWNDAVGNFAFMLGVDPTGGTDPFADTVEWGTKAYIYNEYHQVPLVRTMAEARTATVFLRSHTLWPFKHNDAYWDDVELLGVRGTTPP